jgi:hypothetical protein
MGNGFPVGTGAYFGASVPVAAGAPAAAPDNALVPDDSANLTVVPAGATIKLDGQDFGPRPGRVDIVAGNLVLSGTVASWSENALNITLPRVGLTAPMKAKIVVHRADGSVANETPFQLAASSN